MLYTSKCIDVYDCGIYSHSCVHAVCIFGKMESEPGPLI